MNEKTRIQIEEMKRQTIGVEVEMNNITRENAARIAADYFGTGRYKYTADRNGYYTWSAWDTEGREWKFQRDVSIAGVDSEKCELVSSKHNGKPRKSHSKCIKYFTEQNKQLLQNGKSEIS